LQPVRPDVVSDNVVPVVSLPGISQADFRDAFKVLDECTITDTPVMGFTYPVMGPGGAYGANWWQLDSSLNLAGAKWANQRFAEDACRGFIDVQAENPDGRIDLWGGASVRGTVADLSSIPRYLEVAYDIARRSDDVSLRKQILKSMCDYLDWWFSPVKRDRESGLITAIAEETFGQSPPATLTIAPVDLNVAVAVGCANASALAAELGFSDRSKLYAGRFAQLRTAINKYMWDDSAGYYYTYNVKTREQSKQLLCSTFDPLYKNLAPPERAARLIPKLVDPALFNWGSVTVTSVAKTDPSFCEHTGDYNGTAWCGDIWTMRNMPIIFGLEDAGRHDLAADLAWQTAKLFNRNWHEFLKAGDGSGQGVKRYGWSASQYIQTIIEHIFGVDYDRINNRLRIMPHIPESLRGDTISIKRLILPIGKGARLSLTIAPYGRGRKIVASIEGSVAPGTIDVLLPKTFGRVIDLDTGEVLPIVRELHGIRGASGVRLTMRRSVRLGFE
jgi:hypothetical protein